MVSLDFDQPVPNRTARTTAFLELRGQLLQFLRNQRQTGDHRHPFAFPSLGLASDPDRPTPRHIAGFGRLHGLAHTLGNGPQTARTDSPDAR